MKNYYEILGVPKNASYDEINAIYKALARIYHPDIYKGDKKHAQVKMQEINEAYGILKDDFRRKKYDEQLDISGFENEHGSNYEYDNFKNNEDIQYQELIKKDWEFAIKYHPNIIRDYKEIEIYSKNSAFSFQAILTENKLFKYSSELKERIIKDFFEKYFGEDQGIHDIVKFRWGGTYMN